MRDRPHERPIFQGFCVSPRRQRSLHHCQQLGDLLRIAGAEGSDATAEAVDGRAKAMQLSVVDSRIVDVGWLSRNRSWLRHEGWLRRGWVMVGVVVGWLGKWLCSGWKDG